MKFGIFYELQLPRPWVEGDELRLYQNALTQLETADRCGYDYAWVVEHHFLEEYSHSPAPESFLAAASQRTKQIRLGHGIFQLTTNHPARVAERVAVLDLLSNGRCEFGMGESASITELTPFGRDMESKREVFEEAVAAIFPICRHSFAFCRNSSASFITCSCDFRRMLPRWGHDKRVRLQDEVVTLPGLDLAARDQKRIKMLDHWPAPELAVGRIS